MLSVRPQVTSILPTLSLEVTQSRNKHIVSALLAYCLSFNPMMLAVRVVDTSTFSVDIHAAGFSGLIGLGPNTGSKIRDKIDDASGDSVLSRIFTANQFESNYVTMLLDRYNDPMEQGLTGQMTISEVLPAYQNITSMPKLGLSKVHKLTDADQHW